MGQRPRLADASTGLDLNQARQDKGEGHPYQEKDPRDGVENYICPAESLTRLRGWRGRTWKAPRIPSDPATCHEQDEGSAEHLQLVLAEPYELRECGDETRECSPGAYGGEDGR
jgi:hypothetical protein